MITETERKAEHELFDAAIDRMAQLADFYRVAWEEALAENDRLRALLTGKVSP